MAKRLLGAALAPALLLLVVVLPSPAQAATGCATRGEYADAARGMTHPQVDQLFGAQHVDATSGGAGAVLWTYRACDSRYLVKVAYVVPAHGRATLYTKRWVAAS